MRPVRVLIADAYSPFRQKVASLIDAQPDMEVAGQASNGLDALVKAQDLRPDLILLDATLPEYNGLEAARLLRGLVPEARVVILTALEDEEEFLEAVRNGVHGYIAKNLQPQHLVEMARRAARGEAALSPALAARLMEAFRRLSRSRPEQDPPIEVLTYREQQVLSLVARGATDKEIAQALQISLYTVKSHIRHILGKLQAKNRHHAVLRARHHGLIGPVGSDYPLM